MSEPACSVASPSAADAAREVKGAPKPLDHALAEADRPPTTRVFRAAGKVSTATEETGANFLVRGKQQVKRGAFETDPVVGWLVVVGGPGSGQYRQISRETTPLDGRRRIELRSILAMMRSQARSRLIFGTTVRTAPSCSCPILLKPTWSP